MHKMHKSRCLCAVMQEMSLCDASSLIERDTRSVSRSSTSSPHSQPQCSPAPTAHQPAPGSAPHFPGLVLPLVPLAHSPDAATLSATSDLSAAAASFAAALSSGTCNVSTQNLNAIESPLHAMALAAAAGESVTAQPPLAAAYLSRLVQLLTASAAASGALQPPPLAADANASCAPTRAVAPVPLAVPVAPECPPLDIPPHLPVPVAREARTSGSAEQAATATKQDSPLDLSTTRGSSARQTTSTSITGANHTSNNNSSQTAAAQQALYVDVKVSPLPLPLPLPLGVLGVGGGGGGGAAPGAAVGALPHPFVMPDSSSAPHAPSHQPSPPQVRSVRDLMRTLVLDSCIISLIVSPRSLGHL